MLVWPVCVCVCVRRKKEGRTTLGNQSVSDSWALSMLCQSDLCVCVWLVATFVCFLRECAVAIVEAWSESTKLPITAQSDTAPPRTSSRPHYLAHTHTHAEHTHQSVQPGAHYQTTNPRTVVNLQKKTHGASLTGLHLLISRGRNDI